MTFNPFKNFGKQTTTPQTPRGEGGKFISTKNKEPKPKGQDIVKDVNGPYPITFYGHEVRRYRKDGAWYFSIDDIGRCAHLDGQNPNIGKGNPEKLAEAKEEYVIKIDGIDVATPKDIVKFIPYFKGNMPGPITDWLIENSSLPIPNTKK